MIRRVLVLFLILGAWAFVGTHRAPVPVTVGEAFAGPGAARDDDAPRGPERPSHDLANPKIFTKVILYVKDQYVDPSRIKPKEMMVASLQYVEKAVPDVMVEGSAESGRLKVTVGSKVQTFDISHVDSLWKMSFTIKDIFRFISDNMKPMEDTRDVEYAAINGMLSKLDPHSVLLRPELFREMKLQTKGEFGGLGFVIQMKEGNLTVVRVLPKTPAYRAGIKKDDQIKKIGEESTVNMDLNEAVSKLRGPIDSNVTITVERKGWEKPQEMTLARAMISIESVQHKLLAGNVGYVRLKNFQGNTAPDLQTALQEMQREAAKTTGLKGIVLDLRGNPGGLLEQAIQVSDMFVSHGTVVVTVKPNRREETPASPNAADEAYPLAVLVNAGSASASEIVAGALKNLDRAVIIGRQTFGKGSVQVLYDFQDESALKLTIAKYLTPGDVSIQEVGIVPDVELTPTRVTHDRVDVFAPRRSIGEADLDSHFGNTADGPVATKRDQVVAQHPQYELKYLKEDAKQRDVAARQQLQNEGRSGKLSKDDKGGKKTGHDPLTDVDASGTDEDLDDQLDAEAQDEIKEDFELLFARDFVLKAPFTDRKKMLDAGKPFIAQKRTEEEDRIDAAISQLGLDWSAGPTPSGVQLASSLSPAPEVATKAGDLLGLSVTVENKGKAPLKRLRAWSDSENPLVDRREFLFGALAPGEKKTWSVPVRLPKDLSSRRDALTVKFFDDSGPVGAPLVTELNFVELPRPAFAFNWQVVDRCASCNGDGLAQRGEQIDLLVDVTNAGKGSALDSFAQIKNGADQNIFIEKGRFKLGDLQPGETKTARFVLDVRPGYDRDVFPLKVQVIDEPLEEFASEKVELPIAPEAPAVEAKKGVVRLADKAELLGSPASDAPVIARLPHGGSLAVEGRSGGFYKVTVDKDRFAFVSASEARDAKARPAPLKDVQYVPFRVPPQISLSADSSRGGVAADADRFTLSGTVQSPKSNLDLYVLVNDQKVFFKTVSPTDPESGNVRFSTDFALKEGNNNVLVVARETQEFASRRTLVIHRRESALAQTASGTPPDRKAATP